MAMVGAPTSLNARHFLVALMHAAGFTNRKIADHLNYHENRISIILSSPLMKAQIAELQGELRMGTLGDVAAIIEREAGPSVQVLLEIRDDAMLRLSPQGQSVRKSASEAILDRSRFAKRTHHEEERTIRIAFGPAEIRQILDARALSSEEAS